MAIAYRVLHAVLLVTSSMLAQDLPSVQATPEVTFHSSSDLVLVDVVALNPKNGLSDETLTREDFRVFDDDRPVSIKTFDTGAAARSLSLWFVVQCSMKGWETRGSGLFAAQAGRLEPALHDLTSRDSVAVAHWCDNGESKLDLLPTHNVAQTPSAIEQALASGSDCDCGHNRTGELALQKTLQLIIDSSRSAKPEPLPVLVFLYGDWSAMPKDEANQFIDKLLESSAIVFGLRDTRSPRMGWFLGEQKEVAHYIAAQTGGEYLDVTPDTYASGLQEILRQLHFRYELGFKPEVLDGKRHKLRVELVGSAKERYKALRMRYRVAYVPSRSGM